MDLKLRSITHLCALGDYVIVRTAGNVKYTIHSTMKFMDELLSKEGFIRCHRSFIVNPLWIEKISENEIQIQPFPFDVKIPIGRTYSGRVKQFKDTHKI